MLSGTPSRNPSFVPTGRIWPSGDFSLGYKRVEGDSRVDLRSTRQLIDAGEMRVPDRAGWEYGPYGVPRFNGEGVPGPLDGLPSEEDFALSARTRLDLTDGPNSHKRSNRPETYGRQGMTGFGRKMVRSGCALLERAYKGRLTFATVTMPTLAPDLRVRLAELWPEFVRQGLQWLSRCLERQGLPKAICSVSEVQPKRLRSGNGGYLHLHMVWPNRRARKGHWAVDSQKFRSWCESFLARNGLLPDGAWVNVDVKRVEKSAAAYLSKYMSKGGDVLEEFVADCGWGAVPAQWWNMTKDLRDAVKAELAEGCDVGRLLDAVVNYAFDCGEFDQFWSLRHVDLEIDGVLRTVGWCGILKDEHRRELLSMLPVAA